MTEPTVSRKTRRRGRAGKATTVAQVAAIAGITVAVKAYVFQAFFIPSASMQPVLQPGDRVAVNKLAYRVGELERGDIVVFNGEGSFDLPGAAPRDYIKRVIGLPGDVVSCCSAAGHVLLNGKPLEEQFTAPSDPSPFATTTVPAGHVWVMGDNRDNSMDSRVHGPVPQKSIVGRAEVIYWPVDRKSRLG